MTSVSDEHDRRRPQRRGHSTIRVTRRYHAPAARVFAAWLDPQVAGRWLFATSSRPLAHVEIDARVDGSFCFVDRRVGDVTRYTGEYLEIAPHRRLAFSLCIDASPRFDTRVTVDIVALPVGCEVRLTHDNVPADDAEQVEGRWSGILYGLGVTLNSALALQPDQE